MTSAKSMRSLAGLLGASHQQVGRWLRPRADGSYQQVPETVQTSIDAVFEVHKYVCAEQAAQDKIPFNPDIPVFGYRGNLRTGKPGDRIIYPRTNFIDNKTRTDFITSQYKSKAFVQMSILSEVDAIKYFKAEQDDEGEIYLQGETRLFYTRKSAINPRIINQSAAINNINSQLRQKFEPNSTRDGLAIEMVFQTYPLNYVEPTKTTKARGKTTARSRSTNKRGK